jgi:hypothetical protein
VTDPILAAFTPDIAGARLEVSMLGDWT